MEFSEVLVRRQSCRKFETRPVERKKLMACVEAGRLSPSGCNSQKWMFIVVDDPAKCAAIANALDDQDIRVNTFAHTIPAFIAIVSRPARSLNEKQQFILSHEDTTMIDIGIAGHQICLQATDLGLGSLMMAWIRRDEAKKALDIPPEYGLPLIIGIGYPETDAIRSKTRYSINEVLRFNTCLPID